MRILMSTLRKHRVIVSLMALSVAFTNAAVINSLTMIKDQKRATMYPSGLDERGLYSISTSKPLDDPQDPAQRLTRRADYRAEVESISRIPAVEAAAVMTGLPYMSGVQLEVGVKPLAPNAANGASIQSTFYGGGRNVLCTLGLRLIRGTDFASDSYIAANEFSSLKTVSSAIISAALEKRLFGNASGLGKRIYLGEHPVNVVGIVANLSSLNPTIGGQDNDLGILLPLEPDSQSVTFVVRGKTSDRERILHAVQSILASRDTTLVIEQIGPFSDVRMDYYKMELSMIDLLTVAASTLIAISTAGMMGLFSFWVSQRNSSIGIRRALGATRRDIARLFVLENLTVVSLGAVLGVVASVMANRFIAEYAAVSSIPINLALASSAVLILLGQVAGLMPTIKATFVDPAIVTKSN
jgi:putative ABC transport system permease protein